MRCENLVGIVLMFLASILMSADRADSDEPANRPSLGGEKPVEILKTDSPLNRLLKERFNTALEEARAQLALWNGGAITLQDLSESLQRMARAGVELAETSADQIKYL